MCAMASCQQLFRVSISKNSGNRMGAGSFIYLEWDNQTVRENEISFEAVTLSDDIRVEALSVCVFASAHKHINGWVFAHRIYTHTSIYTYVVQTAGLLSSTRSPIVLVWLENRPCESITFSFTCVVKTGQCFPRVFLRFVTSLFNVTPYTCQKKNHSSQQYTVTSLRLFPPPAISVHRKHAYTLHADTDLIINEQKTNTTQNTASSNHAVVKPAFCAIWLLNTATWTFLTVGCRISLKITDGVIGYFYRICR